MILLDYKMYFQLQICFKNCILKSPIKQQKIANEKITLTVSRS